MAGKVFFIGTGPGDPGLLTVRGARLLQEADVVFYESEVPSAILGLARTGAEKVCLGPLPGRPVPNRRERHREITARALAGQKVACLALGDAMLFGHGGEEALALSAAGVSFEIVPGIPVGLAAAAYAGIPLTQPSLEPAVVIATGRFSQPEPAADETAPGGKPLEDITTHPDSAPTEPLAGAPSRTSAAEPSPPPEVIHEKRIGRGVVVRHRRPGAPQTPFPCDSSTQSPIILARHENVEVVDEKEHSEEHGWISAEKRLMGREEPPAADASEAPAGPDPRWDALAKMGGTIIVHVPEGALGRTVRQLLNEGKSEDEPGAFILAPASNSQRTLQAPLGSLARVADAAGMRGAGILIAGDAVHMREHLNWFESRPLFGMRAALTDLPDRNQGIATALEEEGAQVHQAPLLYLAELPDARAALKESLERIEHFDMIIFPSPMAARIFLQTLWGDSRDVRPLAGRRLVAFYSATAEELVRNGIHPDILVEDFPTRGMVDQLGIKPGHRVLMPRAAQARDLLPMEIHERGAQVEIIPLYETLPNPEGLARLRDLLRAGSLDIILHGTSSGFLRLWESLERSERAPLLSQVAHGCLGASIARTLVSRGVEPGFEVPVPTPPKVVDAVKEFRRRAGGAS